MAKQPPQSSPAKVTSLNVAVRTGDLPRVLNLLSRGADPNAEPVSTKQGPALHEAALRGFDAILAALLDAGGMVDLSSAISSSTPLMLAASAGKLSTVELLLKHQASVEIHGQNALVFALRNDHTAVADALIRRRSDVLDKAMLQGIVHRRYTYQGVPWSEAATSWLLRQGAEPTGRWLWEICSQSSAQMLIRAGADIHFLHDQTGETPLHRVVSLELESTFLMLLQHGANLDVPDASGRTPRDLLNARSGHRLLETLRTWEAVETAHKIIGGESQQAASGLRPLLP